MRISQAAGAIQQLLRSLFGQRKTIGGKQKNQAASGF
jgi:hypothetical protein